MSRKRKASKQAHALMAFHSKFHYFVIFFLFILTIHSSLQRINFSLILFYNLENSTPTTIATLLPSHPIIFICI